MIPSTTLCALLCILGSTVTAHPGHDHLEERHERIEYLARNPKTVRSCASQLQHRSAEAVDRRHAWAKNILAKRTANLVGRDLAAYNKSHAASGVTFGDSVNSLFQDNSSCTLQSEVTQGPYYVDGELIRSDIREGQAGVPLFLDVQLIDTSTCEPMPAVYVDFWHCNSTGVYSGVVANGNGNANDSSNLDDTFLRGIQQSDVNGVVQVETIVPGHYNGRTNHIHVLTHNTNSTIVRTNLTLLSSSGNFTTHASHVGQLFFDQSLISQVEAVAPYNTNTQSHTLNSEDSILATEADTTDPFIQYIQISDNIMDGLLGWISIGIDPTKDQSISSAATRYKEGGLANSNESGPDGPGGPPGNMTGNMPGNMTGGTTPTHT